MRNIYQITITQEHLMEGVVKEEDIFREISLNLVRNMPLEELHKLIKLTKLDPYSEESELALSTGVDNSSSLLRLEIEKIIDLRRTGLVLYSAEVDLP